MDTKEIDEVEEFRDDLYTDVDDEAYTRRRRLKAIHDARERVHRVKFRSRERVSAGAMSEGRRAQLLVDVVQGFLRAVREPLRQLNERQQARWTPPEDEEEDEAERPADLLTELPIASMTLDSPTPDRGTVADAHLIEVSGVPAVLGEGHEIRFFGFDSLIQANPAFQSHWEVEARGHLSGESEEYKVQREYIPAHVALRAFDAAVEILPNELFNYDVGPDSNDAEFEYDDLLMNGQKA